MHLGYVFGFGIEGLLERRLQTQIFKSRLAMRIQHAHVLIRRKHSPVGKQIVNSTSFDACLDFQRHIACALTYPSGGCHKGLTPRKRAATPTNKDVVGNDEDEV
ncbi:40S ribosomal protein S9, partial [Rhizoctonia solani AG-3 Rhs1AP]